MAQVARPHNDPPDAPRHRGPPGRDGSLFGEFLERFAALAESAARLSREVYVRAGLPPERSPEATLQANLAVVRRLSRRHVLEVLTVLYARPSASLDEIRNALDKVPVAEVLESVASLEASGLIQHAPAYGSPETRRYELTHKGTIFARLGEPILLYLHLAEGWTAPPAEPESTRPARAETPK